MLDGFLIDAVYPYQHTSEKDHKKHQGNDWKYADSHDLFEIG